MNQRGFALTALLILMPALLAVLAVISAAYLALADDAKTRHECRVELLRAQTQIAEDLRDLMALNPEASALRSELQAALAGGPEMAPEVATLEAQQMLLAARQEALIARATAHAAGSPELALARVSAAHTGQSARLRRSDPSFHGSTRPATFDVIATPPGSLTPNYEPSPMFSQRLEMKVSWGYQLASFLPRWLIRLLGEPRLETNAECTATLEKEGTRWQAKLKRAKPSLNWSSAPSFSSASF